MKKVKSFGIIEVTISAAIIAMFLGALIGLGASSTKLTVSSDKRLQAVNLAREAVEQIRHSRDTAWLKGNSWSSACHQIFQVAFGRQQIIYNGGGSTCGTYQLSNITTANYVEKFTFSSNGTITKSATPVAEDQTNIGPGTFGRYTTIIDTINTVIVRKIIVKVIWYEASSTNPKSIQIVSYISDWKK